MIASYFRRVRVILRSQESRSIFLLSSGNITNAAVGFVTSIVILRRLDTNGIALLYPLLGILNVTEQVADLGISTSFVKFASAIQHENLLKFQTLCKSFFKTKLCLSGLILVIGQLLAPWITQLVFKSDRYVGWVRITLLMASFSNLSSFHQSYLQIQYRFHALMLTRVVPNLLKVSLIGLLFFFNAVSFEGAYLAFAAVPMGILLLSLFFSGTEYLKVPSAPAGNFMEILHFSKWVLISVVSVAVMGQIDVLMLRSLADPNEVSRLVGGSRIASIFLILSSSLVTVLFPTISSMKTREEIRLYLRRFKLVLPPLGLFLTICMIFSPWIIHLLLGPRYENSVSVFKIYCFQFAVDFFLTPFGLALYNLGKVHILSGLNFTQLLIMILSNYLLIPLLGAEGSALSGLIIRIFAFVLILTICRQEKLIGGAS